MYGSYYLNTIDNKNGVPTSKNYSGINNVKIIVNQTGVSQSYLSPTGTTEIIQHNNMIFWVGNDKITDGFELRNPDALVKGFRISSAGSVNVYGVLQFDNIKFTDLLKRPYLFNQNFNEFTSIQEYISTNNEKDKFNFLSPSSGNLTTSINNQQLRMDRKNPAPSTLSTAINIIGKGSKSSFLKVKEFSFDFQISGEHALKKGGGAINVQLGNSFSETGGLITTRIGINTRDTQGEFYVNTIDNRNGVPTSKNYSGKQKIKIITNQTGATQNYLAPNGFIEYIDNNTMEFWVGNDKVADDFDLRDVNNEINGFRISSAASVNLYGILDFDNIKLKELSKEVAIPFKNLAKTSPTQISLNHPFIWNSYADRDKIVDHINNHVWAHNLFTQLKLRVELQVSKHINNPEIILNTIPPIPGDKTHRNLHTEIIGSMTEAAILYYLTNDKNYAQYAADILNHYMKHLHIQPVKRYAPGEGLLMGDGWLETRTIFPRIALTYDYIYDFLNKYEYTIYELENDRKIEFNNDIAQTTVKNLSDIVFLSIRAPFTNYSILSGNGVLFNILMIDDNTIREDYFEKFYYSYDKSHDPFIWSLNHFSEEGLWPETASYASGSHGLIIQMMNVINRFKPELNILDDYKNILIGFTNYNNYQYPSYEIMRFGNSGNLNYDSGYRSIHHIAKNENFEDLNEISQSNLISIFERNGGRKQIINTEYTEFDDPLKLLWGENLEDKYKNMYPAYPTSYFLSHASTTIQRNYNTNDIKNHGLMYYNGGSNHVHAHSSSIDLELYGKGQLFGVESGAGLFFTAEHDNYRDRRAAHNTVIVNGSGKNGERGTGWSGRNPIGNLLAMEPKPNTDPISTKFCFSTQFMDDIYNDCLLQRTNSIIRTSATTGYYFDNLRSLGKTTNNTHDYIYHNIGDEVSLKFTDNTNLTMTPSLRYEEDTEGNITGLPYFEQVKSSELTERAIDVNFNINTTGKYMLVKIPEGINREYTSALSPTTQNAINGYDRKKTPVITIRKYGEAWDKSFVAIFEPSDTSQGTVKSTNHLYDANQKVVGVTVVSEVDGKTITDYILSNDNNQETINLPNLEINFSGRFGIVRVEDDGALTNTSLYIGEGQQLTYQDKVTFADNEGKAYQTYEDTPTLSVNEINSNEVSFNAYPNPTQDALEIKLPSTIENNIAIEIYDLNAKLISTNNYNINNGKVTVNTSSYSSGLYFVKLNLDRPIYLKFIKN